MLLLFLIALKLVYYGFRESVGSLRHESARFKLISLSFGVLVSTINKEGVGIVM